MASIFRSSNGFRYRIFLSPEIEVGKHPVVIDLVLQTLGRNNSEDNLLDSTGRLHGYQPYIFAASDFAHGVSKSIFGEMRTIDLRPSKMRFGVKVAEARVKPVPENPSSGSAYEFERLTVEITEEDYGKKVAP